MRRAVLGLGLAFMGTGPAVGAPRRSLRAVEVPAAEVEALGVELSDRCRAQVRDELARGRRKDRGCAEDRALIGRAAVGTRDAFGFVERQQVDLTSLRLTLGVARRCRQWPLRQPRRDVLRRTDVAEAGCRLRRYRGELSLTFVDRAGRRSASLDPMRTDRDGRVTLRFADIDRTLRALGAGSLDDYVRIELGEAAWAGHVDLEQLLRFRADWYFNWVSRGRGTPGLFAVRHPEHAAASDARTMDAEARLARQLRDYERVRAGELPADAYFDRYVWSPYHRQLRVWLRTRRAEVQARSEPSEDRPARPQPP